MKKLKFIIVFILWVICLAAQDVIIKRNGDEIKAKVTNLSATEVKYKAIATPGGPDYTLATTDVFMIKYKSGKKDVFDNGVVKTYTANSVKTKQPEPAPVKVCTKTVNDVYTANTIYFYGYDFSHMKFVEDKRTEQGSRITEVINKWQQIINESLTAEYYQKTTKVESFVMLPQYGIEKSKNANPNTIIGAEKSSLNTDSIQKWVYNYNVTETTGIGLIIFIDCFYKPKKNSALTFVFFDIETKKVLTADKYDANEADGYGLPHYWAQSVTATIGHYNANVYRKTRKQLLKK